MDGKVGIGTTDPTTILTIKKPIDSSAYGSGTRMIDFKSYYPGYDETSVKASIYCGVSDDGSLHTRAGYMAFMTSDGDHTPSERMRIERNGNVGIGTTSPSGKLDVNGSTYLDYMETSYGYILKDLLVVGHFIRWGNKWNKDWSKTTTWVDGPKIALRIDSGSIYSQNDPVLHTNSDIRIKKDIEDVPDNLSLEMVRNIPVNIINILMKIEI